MSTPSALFSTVYIFTGCFLWALCANNNNKKKKKKKKKSSKKRKTAHDFDDPMYFSTRIMITQALLVCAMLGGARAFGDFVAPPPSCQGQCDAGLVIGINQEFCMCDPV